MSSQNPIPTPEEFERASRIMKEKSRNLDLIRNSVKDRFQARLFLHDFFILDQRDVNFRAYVFFETNNQLNAAGICLVIEELESFVYLELERLGRGRRDEIKVRFELDSYENVTTKYGGDYYLRLR